MESSSQSSLSSSTMSKDELAWLWIRFFQKERGCCWMMSKERNEFCCWHHFPYKNQDQWCRHTFSFKPRNHSSKLEKIEEMETKAKKLKRKGSDIAPKSHSTWRDVSKLLKVPFDPKFLVGEFNSHVLQH